MRQNQKQGRSAGWGLLGLALAALAAAGAADPAPSSLGQQVQSQPMDMSPEIEEDKRAWNNLHGGWGKRGWQDMNSAWGKRAWQNLHGGWGKRGWQDMNAAWGKRAWNNLHGGWGKRAWSNLHGGWGKRDAADLLELLAASPSPLDQDYMESGNIDVYGPMRQVLNNNAEKILESEADQDAEKRSWSSLHGTWGKRSGDQKWSNFRGSWGKREPGWNNLKGLWGKRSSADSMDDSQGAYLDRQEE